MSLHDQSRNGAMELAMIRLKEDIFSAQPAKYQKSKAAAFDICPDETTTRRRNWGCCCTFALHSQLQTSEPLAAKEQRCKYHRPIGRRCIAPQTSNLQTRHDCCSKLKQQRELRLPVIVDTGNSAFRKIVSRLERGLVNSLG